VGKEGTPLLKGVGSVVGEKTNQAVKRGVMRWMIEREARRWTRRVSRLLTNLVIPGYIWYPWEKVSVQLTYVEKVSVRAQTFMQFRDTY
jgi:hypothetical protein